MKKEMILKELEDIVSKLSIRLQYDDLKKAGVKTRGGLCRVGNEERLIVDKKLDTDEKVEVLSVELSKVNLDNVFIPPRIKVLLQKKSETNTGTAEETAQEAR